MSDLIRAPDCSVYSGRTSAQWWRDRYAEGWRLAIPGAWHGNSTNPFVRDQMGFAQDAGMMLATYVALSQFHSGDEQVAEARYACGDLWPQLEFVALDMELPGLTPTHLYDAFGEAILDEPYESPPSILVYTGYWWWEPWAKVQTGLWPEAFAWVAYYDGRASLDRPSMDDAGRPLAPLAGLGPIIGKQYAGTTIIDGVAVDLNVFDASFLKEEQEMPTENEFANLWREEAGFMDDLRVVQSNTVDVQMEVIAAGRHSSKENVKPEHQAWCEYANCLRAEIAVCKNCLKRCQIWGRGG